MNNKVWMTVALIVLLASVGGGAFYGGMVFQQQQGTDARARFFNERGGGPGGGQPTDGTANAARGGVAGQVKQLDGDTLIISTAQSEVKVQLSGETQIQKFVTAERAELKNGLRVTVRGERDAAGNLTATMIQIVSETPQPRLPASP